MFGCGEPCRPEWSGFAGGLPFGRRADRLRHADAFDRDYLDGLAEARFRGAAFSAPSSGAGGGGGEGGGGSGGASRVSSTTGAGGGRVHTIPSTVETVRLGVFDSTLANIVEIDSGDEVVYPNTWSHFLNRLQPGASIDDLARLRRENPGRGPHSIVGPVGVRGARPGDMLAIEFLTLNPVDWGATFVNPADLRTGAVPEDFPSGQVRYLTLDTTRQRAEFLPGIDVPLEPFQGTFASAPAAGGVVTSVPPGQHAGNIDLRDLTVGATLFLPVWQPTGKLYTGDSHATQGDGEVNNQALESAMREVRTRVTLHQAVPWIWPMAETAEHWIVMGIDADLNTAFRIATRNVIEFLHRRAGLEPLDAYSLASIAISFRVTQFVNQTRGVHAMIPKSLFATDRRAAIAIV